MPSVMERLQQGLAPRYRVEEEIASGGMATVFRATDTSLRRQVAIKVLRPELATAAGVQRLLREARILARFNHPNLVSIHDAGEIEGLFYFVMDYVAGETLHDRLKRGPLAREEVVSLGSDLLAVLKVTHAAGVVHRDIKPGNIFLVEGRALLADFGIARAEISDESLTSDGDLAGTPAYMAPEQRAAAGTTARSDLYAVGLVLYEAFTGRKWPQDAEPDEVDWDGVPRPAEAALRRALAEAPEERWPDADSFAAALDVGAGRRRRRRRLAVTIASVTLAGTAIVLLLLGRERPPPLLDLAVFPCEAEDPPDASAGRQVARILAHNLSGVPGLRLASDYTSFSLYDDQGGDVTAADWVTRLRSANATSCWLRRRDGQFEIDITILNATGSPTHQAKIHAPAEDPPVAAADSAALSILQLMGSVGLSPRVVSRLSGYDIAAVKAFLLGEDAFQRDARSVAERHYLTALSIDSTFTYARWRLADLHRWLAFDTIGVDLQALYRDHASDLSRLDSLLLDARIRPYGPEMFAAYEAILAADAYRYEAYATLLYADELYHRGPLWGVAIDSAFAVFELAVARDSFLAPAVEHLTQITIRQGRQREAARLLAQLRRVSAPANEVIVYYPAMWRQAYLERFEPAEADAGLELLLRQPGMSPIEVLLLGARWVRYVDQPATQERLGASLIEAAGREPILAGAGHLARGLALLSMGRIRQGLAAFDSVAARTGTPEAALQAAEWRVVPYALRLEGFPQTEARLGAETLRAAFENPAFAPTLRARAAWALAALALRDETARDVSLWSARLDSAAAGSGQDRLRRLLDAMRAASSGDHALALRQSEADLAYDSAGRVVRPFVRSALYLQRAEWLRHLGELPQAMATLVWHENTDIATSFPHLVQAAEVDGAFGVWARVRFLRAAHGMSGGLSWLRCSAARDVRRLWWEPDAELRSLVTEAETLARQEGCSP